MNVDLDTAEVEALLVAVKHHLSLISPCRKSVEEGFSPARTPGHIDSAYEKLKAVRPDDLEASLEGVV